MNLALTIIAAFSTFFIASTVHAVKPMNPEWLDCQTDDDCVLVEDVCYFTPANTHSVKAVEAYNASIAPLMDCEMPEMDGITFASTLKDDSQWGHTPIIALSSHTNPEVIARGRAAGFRDYVAKFDREGLIESIRECKPVSENEAAA